MNDRKRLIEQIENLTKPTDHGRYAETGYNDHFNDGVGAVRDFIEDLPDAEPSEQLDNARKALARYRDRNNKPNPEHLADALSDLIAILEGGEVREQARIHYRYGVNSGTLYSANTPEDIKDAVERHERLTMGPIGVEKIETRTRIIRDSEWKEQER